MKDHKFRTMMWNGKDEPLYDERIRGEWVRFIWRQEGELHVIRAEWVRGENPWDVFTTEGRDKVRNQAIQKATDAMDQMISKA